MGYFWLTCWWGSSQLSPLSSACTRSPCTSPPHSPSISWPACCDMSGVCTTLMFYLVQYMVSISIPLLPLLYSWWSHCGVVSLLASLIFIILLLSLIPSCILSLFSLSCSCTALSHSWWFLWPGLGCTLKPLAYKCTWMCSRMVIVGDMFDRRLTKSLAKMECFCWIPIALLSIITRLVCIGFSK